MLNLELAEVKDTLQVGISERANGTETGLCGPSIIADTFGMRALILSGRFNCSCGFKVVTSQSEQPVNQSET